jgi:uncharacterized protein YkwD
MLKRIIAFLVLIAALVVAGFTLSKPSHAPHFSDSLNFVQNLVAELPRQENLPEPLTKRLAGTPPRGEENLRSQSIITLTNKERTNGGLPALRENAILAKAAEAKITDMLKQQYFEHVSPDGKGPADIVTAAGYEYILVGENLAEGDFESNADLVQGWMNSPGHRENIMHPKYTEIGVAARRGIYQGREVWMAVQEFGRPLTDCPRVDENIKIAIAANESRIQTLQAQLEQMSSEMAAAQKRGDTDAYNAMVPPYNDKVAQVNALVAETKTLVARYNQQVQSFNQCIS